MLSEIVGLHVSLHEFIGRKSTLWLESMTNSKMDTKKKRRSSYDKCNIELQSFNVEFDPITWVVSNITWRDADLNPDYNWLL